MRLTRGPGRRRQSAGRAAVISGRRRAQPRELLSDDPRRAATLPAPCRTVCCLVLSPRRCGIPVVELLGVVCASRRPQRRSEPSTMRRRGARRRGPRVVFAHLLTDHHLPFHRPFSALPPRPRLPLSRARPSLSISARGADHVQPSVGGGRDQLDSPSFGAGRGRASCASVPARDRAEAQHLAASAAQTPAVVEASAAVVAGRGLAAPGQGYPCKSSPSPGLLRGPGC